MRNLCSSGDDHNFFFDVVGYVLWTEHMISVSLQGGGRGWGGWRLSKPKKRGKPSIESNSYWALKRSRTIVDDLVEVLIFPLQTLHFKPLLAVRGHWLLAGDQDCDPTKRTVVQVLNWKKKEKIKSIEGLSLSLSLRTNGRQCFKEIHSSSTSLFQEFG